MLKAEGKVVSLLTACLTAIFALVLGFAALFAPTPITTANAAETTEIVFNLGSNGSASHYDGSSATSYSETVSGYTLSITGGTNMYTGARDAKGNSCIKLGTSKKVGSFSFTVPNDVTSVIIAIGKYKTNTSKVTINSTTTTLTNASDNGAYDDITVNTSSTKTVSLTTVASNYRAMVNTITFVIESSAPACDHTDTELTWVYDNGEHYQKCECGEEVGGTRAACSSFNPYYEGQGNGTHIVGEQCTLCDNKTPTGTVDCTPNTWSDWSTADGVHTRTTTCTGCGGALTESANCSTATWGEWNTVGGVHTRTDDCDTCGAAMTESGECNFSAPTIEKIEGDTQHKEIGTCLTCGKATEALVDCTLTYENVSNDDKTHNMTSYCEVCEQSITTENVACTFGEGVVDEVNWTETFTCQYCEYSYTEDLPTCTVTYVIPNGIEEIEQDKVAENFSIALPTADTVEGYTFVGWLTAEVKDEFTEKAEAAPEYLAAESNYTVTEDLTLYALYSYAEGTGAWTKVTDASTLAAGKQIVIVASAYNYALGTTQNNNNRNAVDVTKSDDTVTIDDSVQIITLEDSTVNGQFLFYVEGDSIGYLYAASTSSNHLKTGDKNGTNASWTITIANTGVATIKANQSARNWLRFNNSNSPKIFSCYTSGQTDVSIYMKDGATYYVTEFNTCVHDHQNEVIEPATCTESGSRTVTCLDCKAVLEAEIIPALGHNFVDDVCENCGNVDPASIVYNGSFYLGLSGMYAGEKDGNYYKLSAFTPSETIDTNYVFRFVKNGENYDMYYGDNVTTVTIETQEDYTVRIYNGEGKILSHNTSYTTYQRMGFYATSSNYPAAITLTALTSISSASLTVGESLTMNYYVTTSADLTDATMSFTMNEKTVDVTGVVVDGKYKFSLEIPPQCMTDNISAVLKLGSFVLDVKESYSVQEYAQNKLNDNPSDKLKQLLTDMLYYGAAAQNYTGYNTENLANVGVEKIGTPSTEKPDTTKFKLENAEVASYPVYFKSASLWFGNVNKIRISLSSFDENVSLTINGEAVELTGETVLTEGILATDFDKTYTFELSYNGVVMQTLTYSINAFVYEKQNSDSIGELALALYRYGLAAVDYKNA